MAMGAGLAVINPARSLNVASLPPVVMIDRVSVNGRPVAVYEKRLFSDVAGDAPEPVELRGRMDGFSLGQVVRQVRIEYNVVSFRGQENVRFRYRMEGLDDTWVEAGSQRVAYFSMVPPGQYRFRISACSNEGVWNETGASLALTVVCLSSGRQNGSSCSCGFSPGLWWAWWFGWRPGADTIGVC